MNPLDSLGYMNHAGNAQNALVSGIEFGTAMRQRKMQAEREKATDEAFRGMMGGDPNAVNALAQIPGMAQSAYQMQGQQQQQMQQQQEQGLKQQRQQMEMVSRLLDDARDEPSYQQGLAAAKQMGLDVSAAPPNFDANWVGQQKMIASLFAKDNQELPLMAQELVNAGYQPGTPEFVEAMRKGITSKYSTVKTIPYQAGGGVAAYDTVTGKVTPLIIPEGGEAGGIPEEAISQLKANPATSAQFDEIFGAGAAAKILGGSGGNAAGGFSEWY